MYSLFLYTYMLICTYSHIVNIWIIIKTLPFCEWSYSSMYIYTYTQILATLTFSVLCEYLNIHHIAKAFFFFFFIFVNGSWDLLCSLPALFLSTIINRLLSYYIYCLLWELFWILDALALRTKEEMSHIFHNFTCSWATLCQFVDWTCISLSSSLYIHVFNYLWHIQFRTFSVWTAVFVLHNFTKSPHTFLY